MRSAFVQYKCATEMFFWGGGAVGIVLMKAETRSEKRLKDRHCKEGPDLI